MENFSRGVMVKYGLDYESVKKINPKIIYVALTAFGSDGPLPGIMSCMADPRFTSAAWVR